MNPPPPERLPPHSLTVEKAVLGTVLRNPDLVQDCGELAPDWFYGLAHRMVWVAIQGFTTAGKPWDVTCLVEHLRETGQLESVGGESGITGLLLAATFDALPTHLDILEKKWRLRRLADVCVRAMGALDGSGEAEDIIGAAQSGILEVTEQGGRERERSLQDVMPGVIDVLERFAQGNKVMAGLTTGFNYLDNIMAGWEPAQMYVIAGRPSTGKTSLAVDFILNFARLNGPVAFFSLEMTSMQVAMRMLANEARQDFQTFRNGFINDGDAPRMIEAAGRLAKFGVFIDDTSGLNGQQILMRARRMQHQHGIKMIVIDYLQLMGSTEKFREKRDKVADASEWCKRIAKALNMPVVALAQLNREVEKVGKQRPPMLADLAESGDIEQDADFVGALWRPRIDEEILDVRNTSIEGAKRQFENMKDPISKREFYWLRHLDAGDKANQEPMVNHVALVNLAVLKQRNGPTGDVGFVFYKRQMRFADAGKG